MMLAIWDTSTSLGKLMVFCSQFKISEPEKAPAGTPFFSKGLKELRKRLARLAIEPTSLTELDFCSLRSPSSGPEMVDERPGSVPRSDTFRIKREDVDRDGEGGEEGEVESGVNSSREDTDGLLASDFVTDLFFRFPISMDERVDSW